MFISVVCDSDVSDASMFCSMTSFGRLKMEYAWLNTSITWIAVIWLSCTFKRPNIFPYHWLECSKGKMLAYYSILSIHSSFLQTSSDSLCAFVCNMFCWKTEKVMCVSIMVISFTMKHCNMLGHVPLTVRFYSYYYLSLINYVSGIVDWSSTKINFLICQKFRPICNLREMERHLSTSMKGKSGMILYIGKWEQKIFTYWSVFLRVSIFGYIYNAESRR